MKSCSNLPEDWVSLNTDGFVKFEDNSTTVGGVVRNRNGKWIISYNRFLGSCSVFEAKLWGILDGINLLIDCGLDNVMTHYNSIEVTSHWNIYYIPREENQEADNLARMAHSGRQGLRIFEKPPCGEADLYGIEAQVKKLVEDLKCTSVDTQREATAQLRLLAKHNMDNRIIIANYGAIVLLVDLLHSPDTKAQENAVTTLLNLSINDNNKTAITDADAIEPLIHVPETGSPEAKENSVATLFSLSVIEDNKVNIGRSGAIKPLVDLLGNGTPRGKKDAATALFNLSIFHENKARIVQAGAVKHLVDLMDPVARMVHKP
ncbi:hypothetical protein CXB51_031207 [Gossypium anomalum]|uniref:RING-type E3 ubiquitin transferase n=1 Tax=Gossypium anomalum TaxID=47600 RepID=A0A8J5XT72_9ROSI|nr:hypothetical protein CXB51_031207 [Gossypium anomalum]